MARKTKQELADERLAMADAVAERDSTSYFPRLMAAMEMATNDFNYTLRINQGNFVLVDNDDSWNEPTSFPVTYTKEMLWEVDNLESNLERKIAERAVMEATRLAREAALAKLTPEDRKLLGL